MSNARSAPIRRGTRPLPIRHFHSCICLTGIFSQTLQVGRRYSRAHGILRARQTAVSAGCVWPIPCPNRGHPMRRRVTAAFSCNFVHSPSPPHKQIRGCRRPSLEHAPDSGLAHFRHDPVSGILPEARACVSASAGGLGLNDVFDAYA
jgi:hypothetical protein